MKYYCGLIWGDYLYQSIQFSSVQCSVMSDSLCNHTLLHARPPCPSPTPGVYSLMSIESVMPSNHLILCHPLLLLPSIFPNIRVFSNASVLSIRWPNYWSFSFNIGPSNEHPGLISFRMDSLQSKGLSRVCSNTTVQRHQFFSAHLLYGQTHTSIHDNWKNHSLAYRDFCQQSGVSAF